VPVAAWVVDHSLDDLKWGTVRLRRSFGLVGLQIAKQKKHQPILLWPECADVLSIARFSQKGNRLPDAVTVIPNMSLLTALNRW